MNHLPINGILSNFQFYIIIFKYGDYNNNNMLKTESTQKVNVKKFSYGNKIYIHVKKRDNAFRINANLLARELYIYVSI